MRISQQEKADIIERVNQQISQDANIWRFGSRAKDDAKGGDIDLLLEVNNLPDIVLRKINRRLALEDRWGETDRVKQK